MKRPTHCVEQEEMLEKTDAERQFEGLPEDIQLAVLELATIALPRESYLAHFDLDMDYVINELEPIREWLEKPWPW
jgi:hypothetical protein